MREKQNGEGGSGQMDEIWILGLDNVKCMYIERDGEKYNLKDAWHESQCEVNTLRSDPQWTEDKAVWLHVAMYGYTTWTWYVYLSN
jgi:hypothetical protein